MIGRDEPNNTLMTLTTFIIAQSIRTVYINLIPSKQQTKQSASLQILPSQASFSLRNAVVRSTSCGVPNYLTHTNTKARNMFLNKPTVGSV